MHNYAMIYAHSCCLFISVLHPLISAVERALPLLHQLCHSFQHAILVVYCLRLFKERNIRQGDVIIIRPSQIKYNCRILHRLGNGEGLGCMLLGAGGIDAAGNAALLRIL